MTVMTSRELDRNADRALREVAEGPVFITDGGEPTCVLLSMAEYRRLAGKGMSLLESLAQPGADADFDWEPPKLAGPPGRPVDLD